MGKIAFVFAGQGAQYAGMGEEFYAHSDSVKKLFDMAEAKRKGIKELCFRGPAEQLNETINTQPCLFLTDLACAKVLAENGVAADGAAGFSLGEIPAVCYAGIMSKTQAFDFVCHRASAMQKCAEKHKGMMFAVVKLPAGDVEHICSSIENTYPVNYNCPGQIVVACAEEAAGELQKAVAAQGGKAIQLAVSGAFHSPFMDAASESLTRYLENEWFGMMNIPLYANVTAQVYDAPKALLSKQVSSPVLWQQTVENMIADGFDTFIELGPGKTLSGLIRKINNAVSTYQVCDVESLKNTVAGISK